MPWAFCEKNVSKQVFDRFCQMKTPRDTPFCNNYDVKPLNIRQAFFCAK